MSRLESSRCFCECCDSACECVWPAAIISLQFVSGSRSALIWYDTTAPDPVIAWRVTMLRQGPVMYPYSHPLSIMSPVWWCTSTMCYCLCLHDSRQQQNVTRPLCPHWQLSWAALAPGIVSYFYITSFRYRYKQQPGVIWSVMISIICLWHCRCFRCSILYRAVLLHLSLTHAIQLKAKCPPKCQM